MPIDANLAKRILENNSSFVFTTHVNPDGDGLGSEIALAHLVRKLGKTAFVINHSRTPEHYEWLDAAKEIFLFSVERDREKILQADAIFIMDTNQPERLRSMQPHVLASKAVKVVIDHHLESHPFADQYLIDEEATSTGEIVYHLLTGFDNGFLDREIATALYTAIMTDTGSFRFPRTDSDVHHIAADLIAHGADPTEIFSHIYESWSLGRMRLLGEMLDSMRTAYDGKLAYAVCTEHMFKATGTTEVETDNFTTYPMSVRGVLVGILFNELHNGVKISFRSKGAIPINELAKEFGGNGHLNAAGVRLYNVRLNEVIKAVIEKAEKYLSRRVQRI